MRIIRLVLLSCAALAAVFSVRGDDFRTDSDILYSPSRDVYAQARDRLDVYHPADTSLRLPVVVWFHGGGLTGGERDIPPELKNEGLVVVAPNYRLLPKAQALDSCITDAAAAVAWTLRNIGQYGGDPSQVYVAGHSAGGYLASMIGLDKRWLADYGFDPDSALRAIVPFSGQMITHFAQRRLKGISELQPLIDEYAPLYHVRKMAPLFVIITGDPDHELFGRHEEDLYMWRMMRLVGNDNTEIYRLDGFDHGAMASPAHHILKDLIRRTSHAATPAKKE